MITILLDSSEEEAKSPHTDSVLKGENELYVCLYQHMHSENICISLSLKMYNHSH